MFSNGVALTILGAGIAAILAGAGSAIGVRAGGVAAAGVASEKPELFGKLLVLQALPGTQGIYGFLTAVLILTTSGLMGGGAAVNIPVSQGWAYLFAGLPIGVVGLVSAMHQAKVAVAAIHMTAKQADASGKGITMTVLVETYAILALLVSLLLVLNATQYAI